MAKPTDVPRWADDGGDIVEPLEGKKDIGYEDAELPTHSEMNWLFNLIYQWAVWLDGLQDEALTWTKLNTFTQSVANTRAIHATGNGTAGGALFTGGATGGAAAYGIKGVGGGGNSEGVVGDGTGAGSGVKGIGGATGGSGVSGIGGAGDGNGVWGDANGAGSGVKGVGSATAGSRGVIGTGGSTSGTGVEGVGGGGNSTGVKGLGAGSAAGVWGTGGGSSGTGVSGTGGAGNGNGVWGDGTGAGSGVKGIGGATGGSAGVTGTSAATNGHGGSFTGSGTGVGVLAGAATADQAAVYITTGSLEFGTIGTYPDSDDAVSNKLTPLNFDKAWGLIACDGTTGDIMVDGFNTADATQLISTGLNGMITVSFAEPMASDDYFVQVLCENGPVYGAEISGKTVNKFDFRPQNIQDLTYPDAATLDSGGYVFSFVVKGRQF